MQESPSGTNTTTATDSYGPNEKSRWNDRLRDITEASTGSTRLRLLTWFTFTVAPLALISASLLGILPFKLNIQFQRSILQTAIDSIITSYLAYVAGVFVIFPYRLVVRPIFEDMPGGRQVVVGNRPLILADIPLILIESTFVFGAALYLKDVTPAIITTALNVVFLLSLLDVIGLKWALQALARTLFG